MKTCSKCGELKPLEGFHKNKNTKDGLRPHCKSCRSLESHEHYKKSPSAVEFAEKKQRIDEAAKKGLRTCSCCEKIKPIEDFYRNLNACKPCKQENFRIRKQKNPLRLTEISRKCKYGIMPEDFAQICLNQQNKCKICAEEFKETLHIDHCHATKKIRGLLCQKCNLGLGMFLDSPSRLIAAANYLLTAPRLGGILT